MNEEVRPKRVCSPKYAVMKARKGKRLNRWELEDLAKDPELSLKYAEIIGRRFPEGESEIARRPKLALEYATKVIKGRFPEAEESLVQHIQHFYLGSSTVRDYFIRYGVRNDQVESYIIERDGSLAGEYAKHCVGGRWHTVEKSLLKKGGRLENAIDYQSNVFQGRWPELESRILLGKNMSYWDSPVECFRKYLENVGRRSSEVEDNLMKCSKASMILAYAVFSCKGRLPKHLHQKMMMFSFDPKRQKFVKKYLKFLEKKEKVVVEYLSGLEEDERMKLLAQARTN